MTDVIGSEYEGFKITNVVGGKTLQEIAEMPWRESVRHMREYVHPSWGKDCPSKKRKYKVTVRCETVDYIDKFVEAWDEDDVHHIINKDPERRAFDEFQIVSKKETPCS